MSDALQHAGRMLVLGIRGADPETPELLEDLAICAEAGVGGIVLFDRDLPSGGARNIESQSQLRELTRCLRERLGDDILIMVDQEGGKVARLNAATGFAAGITAEAFAQLDEQSQREAAQVQAEQLASAGINVNLAPVVDLALNLSSDVIRGLGRSFGADADRATACARVWIEEHRKAGVASCLKHFPGHGSAAADSHRGLVEITDRDSRETEMTPYRRLADEPGVMLMTGHLLDRVVDPELPASLSEAHTRATLRDEIGFDGLVVTDSIDMGAITERWSPGKAAALAVLAGADLVMDCVNAPGPPRRCPALLMAESIAGSVSDIESRSRRATERRASLFRSISR